MIRFSKTLALGAVAGLALAAAFTLAPAGQAAVSHKAPGLTHLFSGADLDHAHGAFEGFRNRLDGAPRPAEPRQSAAIQGERMPACAGHAWPHIPPACQSSAEGLHLRQVRRVALDATR